MDASAAPPVPETAAPQGDAAKCPVPHQLISAAPGCPIDHTKMRPPVHRSKADEFVWRTLRIKEHEQGATSASAYRMFQKSMTISALRCTLTYVIFPIVFPLIGIAKGMGPIIGVFVGSFAITCDVFTIRRFFSVDHRWRWYFSAIALSIISLLLVLLVRDWIDLLT
jgi:hypothetical protein